MYLKALDNIFQYNFQRITFLAVVTIVAGCSSGSQRFSNISSHHRIAPQLNIANSMSTDPGMLSYGGEMIQSTELPPVEPSDDSSIDDNSLYNFSQQGRGVSSDDRVMGAPPRNIGTLSRSQMNNSPLFRQNSYIVQSGDTLLSIARQVGVSVEALKSANGINSNSIYIGQVLVLPNGRTLATSRASSHNNRVASTAESSFQPQVTSSIKNKKASPIYKAPVKTPPSAQVNRSSPERSSSKEMVQLNHESDLSSTITRTDNIKAPQATGISKMRWPVRGRLLSQFGQKKGTIMNRGIDIAVPEGSSVRAAENGVVIYAGDGLKELGNVVMIRHENNIITIYGCNSQLVVNKGQRVRRGDEIAKSGISGNVKTPRVYFEMRKNSLPVDPLKYLEN
ncbi:M23 family metallopeptidase [Bartonella krasnovii]|uniref:M23 family metallopeptidase n=1 Tax=Bartonella krasnovii TaxID=2267275 RepID=A0ABY3VZP8_9HYPH|nr:M23 family metallopeptidase [Bartonella krasnovii]UNF29619.1 M23 family metallopeptidase [Bartonella krasnovii]UNF35978.1 M23 family metallopeptidase [Bartonella krasnovii]UNF37590.1 M23 family metallopeptidase [Bartonella krasnovii]UNF49165.1 M23 family metallopeptidase [Bartonella krasnovii]